MAEAAGLDADEHLARAGWIDRQLLDRRCRVGLRVDDAAGHVGASQLFVEGHERQLGTSPSALGSLTTLSPSSSIVS